METDSAINPEVTLSGKPLTLSDAFSQQDGRAEHPKRTHSSGHVCILTRGGVATAHGATIVPPLAQGPVLSPGLLRVVFSFQEVDENQTFLVCFFFGGRGEKGCNLRT